MKSYTFNINRQERIALIFLLTTALLGLSINLCLKLWPAIDRFPQRVFYEYGNSNSKLDINKIPADTFIKLPGIGPVIAERIVRYREKNGNFDNLEELKNIDGIGDKKFKKLENLLTVN